MLKLNTRKLALNLFATRRLSPVWLFYLFLTLTGLVLLIGKVGLKDNVSSNEQFRALVIGPGPVSVYLSHVIRVLSTLGYKVDVISGDIGSNSTFNWKILWSHSYPFNSRLQLKKLKPDQRVNKLPGMGYITNKVDLAKLLSPHIPVAFRMPLEDAEFHAHVIAHPEKLWVTKSNQHRGIFILKSPNTRDLFTSRESQFVQEFIQQPLLIDNRKFDIGIYVVITSVDPLRVYAFNADALFRFCAKDYEPFDISNTDSYVVGDEYTPLWKMPSLKTHFQKGFNFKQSFNIYLKSKGFETNFIWDQMYGVIAKVFLENQSRLIDSLYGYNSQHNFFEMVRFDFILAHVENQLHAFLMEVNMSPNLSSQHYPPNKRLYEQVLFNLFSLTGIKFGEYTLGSNVDNAKMVVDEGEIITYGFNGESCAFCTCDGTTLGAKNWFSPCRLCLPCLDESERLSLKDAFVEHINKASMKRIVPSENLTNKSKNSFAGIKPKDLLLKEWIKVKQFN